jgi:hypothetical protein
VHPDGRAVDGEPGAHEPRNDQAHCGRIPFPEIVRAFHGDEGRDRHRNRFSLPHRVVLAGELDRLVDRGTVRRGLQVPCDTVPVLETNRGTLIEPEQVTQLVPKLPRRGSIEAVRQESSTRGAGASAWTAG